MARQLKKNNLFCGFPYQTLTCIRIRYNWIRNTVYGLKSRAANSDPTVKKSQIPILLSRKTGSGSLKKKNRIRMDFIRTRPPRETGSSVTELEEKTRIRILPKPPDPHQRWWYYKTAAAASLWHSSYFNLFNQKPALVIFKVKSLSLSLLLVLSLSFRLFFSHSISFSL